MQTAAIVFFLIAGLLSAALFPNNLHLIPLVTLSLPRAIALAVALLFWVLCGKLDNWGLPRLTLAVLALVGVVALTFGCFMIQVTRDDNVPASYALFYRVAAALLPTAFIAGALLSSRTTVLAVSVLAPIVGILVGATWKPVNAKYVESLPENKARRELDRRAASRVAEVDAVPDSAGPEALLRFVTPDELSEAVQRAQQRIEQSPDWIDRLVAMLPGDNRLPALYTLTRRAKRLPPAVQEKCWAAAASIASDEAARTRNGASPKKANLRMLMESVSALGDDAEAARYQHAKTIAATWNLVLAANVSSQTSLLEFWVRENEYRAIPASAGILPLLEFTGPFEVTNIREEARQRIAKTPNATAKLLQLLDGPHRLHALTVLTGQVEVLTPAQREWCWRAVVSAARDMMAAVAANTPVKQQDVRILSASAGLLWPKLGPDTTTYAADLATIRKAVRAAGDQYEKANMDWADPILAGAGK